MSSRSGLLIATAVACLALGTAPSVRAQVQYGPQLDWASNNIGFGVGGRVEASLAKAIPTVKGLGVVGAFNVYFPAGGTAWSIDAGGTYHFDIPTARTIAPYVGASLAVFHGIRRTGGGLNIFAGADFSALGALTPFAELKLVLVRSTSAFVLTGGVLF